MDEGMMRLTLKSADRAAAIARKNPADGYSYAVSVLFAILTSRVSPAEEKVERAVLFIVDFEARRVKDEAVDH